MITANVICHIDIAASNIYLPCAFDKGGSAMRRAATEDFAAGDPPEDAGCGFILETPQGSPLRFCPAPAAPGSPYCAEHARRCRLAPGSAAEQRQLAALDALAGIVGGRRGRTRRQPPPPLLRRLERTERHFFS